MLSLNTPWGWWRTLAVLFLRESHRLGWPPLTMSLKMAEFLIVLSPRPGYCDYSLAPPHPVLAVLRMDEIQGFQNARQALYRLSCIPALTKRFFKKCSSHTLSQPNPVGKTTASHPILEPRGAIYHQTPMSDNNTPHTPTASGDLPSRCYQSS